MHGTYIYEYFTQTTPSGVKRSEKQPLSHPGEVSPSGDHGHTSRVKHNAAESAVIKLYEVSILLTFSADEATTATKKPHTDFVIFLLW